MRLTERRLNRATLARQLLLERQRDPRGGRRPADRRAPGPGAAVAVHRALEPRRRVRPGGPGPGPREQRIVKATLMRITLHAVAADDYPAIHEAMQGSLRAARLNDRRFRSENVSDRGGRGARAGPPRVRDAPRGNKRHGVLDRGAVRRPEAAGLVGPAPVRADRPCDDRRALGVRAAAGVRRRDDQDRPGDPAASVQHLVRRYLEGFGPATMPDIAQFSTIVPAADQGGVRRSSATSWSAHEGPTGAVLYDVPGCPSRRGHAGPAAADGDVGQHAAGVRGSRPDDAARRTASS